MTHRLELVTRLDALPQWLTTWVAFLILVLAGKFAVHGGRHVLWFGSAPETDNVIAHNPFYAIFLMGLTFVFSALCISGFAHDSRMARRSQRAIPWALSLWTAGLVAMALPWSKTGTLMEVTGWGLFTAGTMSMALHLEWHGIPASAVMAIGGVLLVLLAGLVPSILELIHWLSSGGVDYLPAVDANTRRFLVRREIGLSVPVAAVGLDAFIALFITGRALTPVNWRETVAYLSDTRGFLGLVLCEAWAVCLVLVLWGQGTVVRYCLWAIFHGFVLDALPFSQYLYAGMAIAIHYGIAGVKITRTQA